MDAETTKFVLSISGTVILILFTGIGFFISRLINDVKINTMESGKNKGKIELVQQQQQSDIKRIEERTQLELSNMSKSIKILSDNVNILCQAMNKHNINL